MPAFGVRPLLLVWLLLSGTLFAEPLKRTELRFEPNQGQFGEHVRFVARSDRGAILFTESGIETSGGSRVRFPGALTNPVITAEELTTTRLNYFMGGDPRNWRTNVKTYRKLRYHRLWPGIDLVFHATGENLEYDFVVRPGADPSVIRLGIDGQPAITPQGDLIAGLARHLKPSAYQETNGVRREVGSSFCLLGGEIGFQLGSFDRSAPLIIDPVLVYSTFLTIVGDLYSSGVAPVARSVAVDAQGSAYITGYSPSPTFPTTAGVVQPQFGMGSYNQSYISKLDASGTKLLFSTFIGGDGFDQGAAIAIDAAGNVYAAGTTNSKSFPVTPGAYRTQASAQFESYLVKLSSDGSRLLYSTYLGALSPTGLTVDSAGNAYVTGNSTGSGLTTTSGVYQPSPASTSQTGYIMKLNPAGSALVYATYLGGSVAENVTAMALDAVGNVYVAGATYSSDFPASPSAAQPNCSSRTCSSAFVTKLNPTGTQLVYSTFLGGSAVDAANAIVIDGSENAYVAGATSSPDFPVTPGALQSAYDPQGGTIVFITKIDPTGSRFVFSTCLGPPVTNASASAIAVDANGRVFVAGITASFTFPVTPDALQSSSPGIPYYLSHGFFSEIDATGSKLLYSTWLSGTLNDMLTAMTLAPSGDLYIVGQSQSPDWPTTTGTIATGLAYMNYSPIVLRMAVGDISPYPAVLDFPDLLPHSQPSSAALNIYAPAASFAFQAGVDSPWLSLTPTSGTATAVVQVTANPAAQSLGEHTGNISITAPSGRVAPQTIPVTMEVVTLDVSPRSLNITTPRTLQVTGGNAISFTAVSDANWIVPGVGAGVTPARLQISANTQSLAPGRYSTTLTLVPYGSPADSVEIPIVVDVGELHRHRKEIVKPVE